MKYTFIFLVFIFVTSAFPQSDPYEPNNHDTSAYAVTVGDSVVKNAMVTGDSDTGTSDGDADFFKVTLTAGMAVTFSTFPCYVNPDTAFLLPSYGSQTPHILISNPAGDFCIAGFNSVTIKTVRTGIHYCRISCNVGQWCKYGLSIRQSSGDITITSPSGGESFSGGQKVTVKWTRGDQIKPVKAMFSIDDGMWWKTIAGYFDGDSCLWVVPHLKERRDSVSIKVTTEGYGFFDITNAFFTIQASPLDTYEPNDDFASACSVTVGDSVVKNAIVIGHFAPDTGGTISGIDEDFYKVALAGNMPTRIATGHWPAQEDTSGQNGPPSVYLYDASRNLIASGRGSLYCVTSQSGIYYCRVSNEADGWCKYGMSIYQGGCDIAIVSPNGGESVSAWQTVSVKWTKGDRITWVDAAFSVDNGVSWTGFARVKDSNSCQWVVPPLKNRTDAALIKVTAANMENPPSDVSNATFTIMASPPDNYEQNNSFATAYPISMGDSAVKNAEVIGFTYPFDSIGPKVEADFFKITLKAGTTVYATAFPWLNGTVEDPNSSLMYIGIFLYDSSHNILGGGGPRWEFPVFYDGVHYMAITSRVEHSCRYGISIKARTVLSEQAAPLDSNSLQKVGDTYKTQMKFDSTKLSIDLTLKAKIDGWIRTQVLLPGDFDSAANTRAAIKAVSIEADDRLDASITSADIAIPYSQSDIYGYSENSLTALWFDDSARQWAPVDYEVDSAKNQIIAHTMHFSLYGVFIKSLTPIASVAAKGAAVFGIQANFISPKRSLAVHFALPKATTAELCLYDVRGKCVNKSAISVGLGNSTILWNLGALANGKYFLSMKAGAFSAKKAMLIMN